MFKNFSILVLSIALSFIAGVLATKTCPIFKDNNLFRSCSCVEDCCKPNQVNPLVVAPKELSKTE